MNDNSIDSGKWFVNDTNSPAIVTEQNQQLRITVPPNTATYNGLTSNSTYDLRGGTVQVEVVQSVSQAGWTDNSLFGWLDGSNYYQIGCGAGSIVLHARVNGVEDASNIPYSSVTHRFWRLRHSRDNEHREF